MNKSIVPIDLLESFSYNIDIYSDFLKISGYKEVNVRKSLQTVFVKCRQRGFKRMSLKWKNGLALVSSTMVLAGILAGCGSSTSVNNSSTAPTSNGTSTNASGTTGNSTGSSTDSSQPVMGGTLQLDVGQDFSHLDPALAYDIIDWEVLYQVYTPLVTFKGSTTEITALGATTWDVSSDGKTYTFHLRKDMTFTNGDKVTAQSYIDEFQRVLDKSINSPAEGFIDPLVEGATAYHAGTAKSITGLKASDPYTLVITLTKAEPFFLDVLAMPFFSAVDQSYITKIGDKAFDHQTMGSGPFQQKSYQPGRQLALTKNPNYFIANTPKLDEVDMDINSNLQASALKFKQGISGFLSWNQSIDSQDFVSMLNDPQYKNDFYKQNEVATYYIALNTKPKSPIQKKLVRQAINMAVDKQKLVKLLNGRAAVTNQVLPPAMPGYEKSLPANIDYQYNPTEAKKLLAQAGYSTGFTVSMVSSTNSTVELLTQSIQSDLAQVGITVKLHPEAESSWLQDSTNLTYPLGFSDWFQDFPDPYDFLDVLLNGKQIGANNVANYNNPTVNKELAQAATMANGPDRDALYSKIQNEMLADAPWVPLYNPVEYSLVQPWVKGFYMSPVMLDPLQNIWIAKH